MVEATMLNVCFSSSCFKAKRFLESPVRGLSPFSHFVCFLFCVCLLSETQCICWCCFLSWHVCCGAWAVISPLSVLCFYFCISIFCSTVLSRSSVSISTDSRSLFRCCCGSRVSSLLVAVGAACDASFCAKHIDLSRAHPCVAVLLDDPLRATT